MAAGTASSRHPAPLPGALDGLEACLVATVPPIMRHLLAHARRRPAWAELTYQQYNVMRMIDRDGPIAQAEIARGLLVSAPVITRLAAALVDAGLVERRDDPHDRRSVRLALTRRGKRRVRAMRRELLEAATELLLPIPADRRGDLARALEELQLLLPGHTPPADASVNGSG
jgi:DNA-binding MarR family transcriptional regulator